MLIFSTSKDDFSTLSLAHQYSFQALGLEDILKPPSFSV